MTLLHPFRAWRPRPGLEQRVATPPYDVLNSSEARTMATGNPESFLRVTKAEINLEPGISPHDDRVYATASERFKAFIDTGVLIQDPAPGYSIYRLAMGSRAQIGVAAVASVDAYLTERIKKHEFTRPDKENDRFRLADTLNAHTGPVFLTYRHNPMIETLTNDWLLSHSPVCDFMADDQVRHTVWVVDDPTVIQALTNAFDLIPALYIADGHHRAAAAARVCQQRRLRHNHSNNEMSHDFLLAVAFPDTQVHILDYNRLVRDLNGQTAVEFIWKVMKNFQVLPSDLPVRPRQRHEFGMYINGHWFKLQTNLTPEQERDPQARLDVTILQETLLNPLLGITKPREDTRIDFVGGIRGVNELMQRVDSGEMAVAFSMFPTGIEELMTIADAGLVMPPKSTWFEPKLRDGLMIQTF